DKLYRIKVNPKLLGTYYIHYLGTQYARQTILVGANGASPSMQNIGQGVIKEMQLLIPPIDEQKGIVNHLEVLSAKTNEIVEKHSTEISKLREYKSTLINAAVTGKIKVS